MPNEPHDGEFTIRPATATDLTWLTDLSTQTSFANGFTPRSAIADHIERQDYTVLVLRGQRAAFMFTSGGRRAPFRIVQSAVSLELWRQGYGRKVFEAVAMRAYARKHSLPTCTVRDNLESNAFWRTLGALHVDTTAGGKARGRQLLHYAWTAHAAHAHATAGAMDARIQIPEADQIRRIIDNVGTLPPPTGDPSTNTSRAKHVGGIALAMRPQQRRRAIARTPDDHRSGIVRALDAPSPAT